MKKLIKTFSILILCLFVCGWQEAKGSSTDVYVFMDLSYYNPHMPIYLNGKKFTTLDPEPRSSLSDGTVMLYKMAMRKIEFKKEGTYVMEVEAGNGYKASVTLNIVDGQTQYVLVNGNLKRSFYAELTTEKKGLRLLKKAQGKKYTINSPVVYYGK